MADDLRQEFTLDASDALRQLDLLDKGFKQLATTLNSFRGGNFNREGQGIGRTADSLGGAFTRANANTVRFTTSLQLLSRIVFTQAVIRGLRLIEQGASRAATAFSSFEKVLSEIKAISPGDTLADLSKTSQGLSDAFNIPLLDVAKSRYDLISNGFTNAADQQQVFIAAAKLGKLGVADQTQAIDLLSTSLNAYGADARDATRFARLFFQGANVGKFTIAELSANLGKAAPAAKSLGVEMEDLIALFSSLTVKGVSAPEAATQINSLFAAFIKPSEGMTDALERLGVTSGQELIRLRGFAGALQAVTSTTDGSSVALAKLFPNVRALRGVLTEANDGFQTLNTHLKSFHDLTQEEFEARLCERRNTDAERASAAINKLKNAVTIGLGGGLIETAATLDRMTGKVDTLSTAVEKFFRIITGHAVDDTLEAFDNIANRDVTAAHNQLQKQLNDLNRVRDQILDKARTSQTLPLGARDVAELTKTLDGAFNVATVRAYNAEIEKTFERIRATANNRESVSPQLAKEFETQIDALQRLSQQAKVTDDELRPLLQRFQEIESNLPGNINRRIAFGPQLENVNRIMEQILARRALLEQLPLGNDAELQKVLNAADQLQAASVASSQNVSGALVNGANAIETAGQSAAQAIQQAAAAAAAAGGGGGGQAFGGLIRGYADGGPVVPFHYMAAGGKGTDTVPAMLTPGEFVINARSAGKFFPQLQAINAGIAPSFPSVTNNSNVSIGDINVNANDSEAIVKEVATALRRQLRRGVIKPF
ncbi:MAG: phage tail tape measure protein [Planctomycetota bacterium]|nr:MAG: phage tail tape measure protein [Planctomycetota bacterium]